MTMYVTFISFLAILVVVVPYTQGQPINDECIDAIDIDASSNVTISGDTTDAVPTDFNGELIPIVWYRDESPVDEIVVGTVCPEDLSLYPVLLVLRDESCESQEYMFEDLQYFEAPGCISFETTIKANVVFRMFIYLVDSEYTYYEGKFVMTLSASTINRPPNDECIDAINIDASLNVTISGDTTNAVPIDIYGDLYPSVWYQDESSIDEVVVGTVCAEDLMLYPRLVILRDESCESGTNFFEFFPFSESRCISFETTITANVAFRMFIFLVDSDIANVEGKFVMTLSARTANPPPNDECIEAITVDAASNETIKGDTTDARASIVPSGVWYTTETSSVDTLVTATICSEDSALSGRVDIYTGENCESLVGVIVTAFSVGECSYYEYPIDSNPLHWLLAYVVNNTGNNEFVVVDGAFNMTLRSVEPPPNDECTDAILVDPIAGQEVIGTPSDVGYLYYKSEGVFGNDIAITATLCTGDGVGNSLNVYEGNCDNALIYIGGNFTDGSGGCVSYTFIPYKNSTYIFLISTNDGSGNPGEFTFSVTITRTFFELIDSTVDAGIGAMQNEIRYRDSVTSPRLNIRANFDASIPVKSVRLTLTNPTRSICERAAPYSLFGDINGNYNNGTIPLGTHVVTATPYAQRSCRGPAGPQLTQSFEVYGCNIFYFVIDDDANIDDSLDYILLPCPFFIQVYVTCGFEPTVVRFDLRNTKSNRIIRSVVGSTFPYLLYDGVVGKLGVGNYTIAATIDGIYHPPTVTFVVNETCV